VRRVQHAETKLLALLLLTTDCGRSLPNSTRREHRPAVGGARREERLGPPVGRAVRDSLEDVDPTHAATSTLPVVVATAGVNSSEAEDAFKFRPGRIIPAPVAPARTDRSD
jgi:hypothetical protein